MQNLKEFVIQESFDYKAENGDGASDWRADYFKQILELLKETVKKIRKSEDKYKDKPNDCPEGGWEYTVIGVVNPVIEMIINSDNCWCLNTDKELLDILDEAIEKTRNCERFHQGWKEGPEKLDKNLDEYQKKVDSYRKFLDKKYEKINNKL